MEKDNRKHGLYKKTLLITMTPLFFCLVVLLIASFRLASTSVVHEIEKQLNDNANLYLELLDLKYPGDYRKVGDDKIAIYKGDILLNNNYEYIDQICKDNDIDLTVFYKDMRVITTLKDSDGNRRVGSKIGSNVSSSVFVNGQIKFYDNIEVDGKKYFGHYEPIYNSDGSIFGMIGVMESADKVEKYVLSKLYPVIFIILGSMLLIASFIIKGNKGMIRDIRELNEVCEDISKGKLETEPSSKIIGRKDEIGEMANSVQIMRKSLRGMIELDTLTQINNRLSGEKKLNAALAELKTSGVRFAVGICDIDFFKQVNDNYGHDAGDIVLKEFAKVLKTQMVGKGFTARWGGEEFLLVYNKVSQEKAYDMLNEILEEVRNKEIKLKDESIKITVSAGLTKVDEAETSNIILNRADILLYKAKNSGRDRMLSDIKE